MSHPVRLAIGVLAGLIVFGLGGSALQFRAQRDGARTEAGRLRASVANSNREIDSLRLSADNSGLVDQIAGLDAQVAYDKSHLLDCWVIIQRIAPPDLLTRALATYPVPPEHTARSTRTLVDRCASDALP